LHVTVVTDVRVAAGRQRRAHAFPTTLSPITFFYHYT
jgi:hypothetical protein